MKIYVVETIADYCTQIGFSLSKKTAQKIADSYNNDKTFRHNEFFVTEYEVDNNNDFCEFDNY